MTKPKSLRFLWVSADKLVPNQWNPNTQTKEMYEKTKNSIKEFGFVAPVIARPLPDGNFEIIDGEHRWKAAKELGLTQIPIIVCEGLDEPTIKRLSLALNRLHGEDDVLKLADLMSDLLQHYDLSTLLSTLPYTEESIQWLFEWQKELTWEEIVESDKAKSMSSPSGIVSLAPAEEKETPEVKVADHTTLEELSQKLIETLEAITPTTSLSLPELVTLLMDFLWQQRNSWVRFLKKRNVVK